MLYAMVLVYVIMFRWLAKCFVYYFLRRDAPIVCFMVDRDYGLRERHYLVSIVYVYREMRRGSKVVIMRDIVCNLCLCFIAAIFISSF